VAGADGARVQRARAPRIARDTGLGRESVYKALSPSGNPEFATIMEVVAAMGLKLNAMPAGA
jgi:probable addiction module antidote protein